MLPIAVQKRLKNRRALTIIQRLPSLPTRVLRVSSDSESDDVGTAVCSPCIKVCLLDGEGVCTGCGRHIDEIAAWSRLSAPQQRSICELAAQRRQQRAACQHTS